MKLTLDPVTRIEGHLRIDTRVEQGKVVESWSQGEMFRGFESLLSGRNFLDAPVITQRICGVCPISHAIASCRAIESALGIEVPENGHLIRNLILGANFLQNHILHFYQLSALDYIEIENIINYQGTNSVLRDIQKWAKQELTSNRVMPLSPLRPHSLADFPAETDWNLETLAHYMEALKMRSKAHSMGALFGGKMPHSASLVPGGVTAAATWENLENFRNRLKEIEQFVDGAYLPDAIKMVSLFPQYATIGNSGDGYLSYGEFAENNSHWAPAGVLLNGGLSTFDVSQVKETVTTSYYQDAPPAAPGSDFIKPQFHKEGAYTWIKAPRYAGKPCETGPLARFQIGLAQGNQDIAKAVDNGFAAAGIERSHMNSVAGRHLIRALEASLLTKQMYQWLDAINPDRPTVAPMTRAAASGSGTGVGYAEAPRGALGHWITIQNGKIAKYDCVVPSTWVFSPRDDQGQPGPVEAALLGTPIEESYQGLEVARVVRSFDPCIACAIH